MPGLTQLFNKLNNYNYTDQYVNMIRNYLRSRGTANLVFPAGFTDYQKLHTAVQYRDFELRGHNDDIYYRPLDLLVIPESEKQQTLQDLYDDFDISAGVGIRTFYDKVMQRYLGIKRTDVETFLPQQQLYQMSRPRGRRPVNRPIIGTFPNQRWAIDLIDVNRYTGHNHQNKYILTCIDYFSKKVWARGITERRATNIRDALIFITNQAHTYPLILQSDNGPEFKNNIVGQWALNHNIKWVNTTSYTPQSNGLIENFNGKLRKMMRDGFLRNQNFDWYNYLQSYCDNRNDSKHSSTKATPNQLWTQGRVAIPIMTPAERERVRNNDQIPVNDVERRKKAYVNLQAKATKMLERHNAAQFQVGDRVRVLMSAINSHTRALIKGGDLNQVVNYSPNIFTVDKVIEAQGLHKDFTRERYWLLNNLGQPQLREYKANKPNDVYGKQYFFASELQLVPAGSVINNSDIDNAKANYLNKSETVEDKEVKKKKAKEKKALQPKPIKKVIEEVDRSLLKRNKPNPKYL